MDFKDDSIKEIKLNDDEIRKHCGDDKLINGLNEELVFD